MSTRPWGASPRCMDNALTMAPPQLKPKIATETRQLCSLAQEGRNLGAAALEPHRLATGPEVALTPPIALPHSVECNRPVCSTGGPTEG